MEEKLNVCLLNDSFPPVIDGVANTVINYAQIINKNHGNVVVATPSYPNAVDDYPFPVYRYPSIDTTKLIGYRAGYPFDASTLIGLDKNKMDIIHSHCPVTSTMVARTLRKLNNVPIVLTYHTKFDVDIAKAVKSNFIQNAAIKFLAESISSVDEVWAVSKGAGENMKKLGYQGDYIIMENGVDFPRGRASEAEILKVSKSHDLTEEVPVFLFVGRMMWYKGIRLIIDAVRRAKENGEKLKMIFVGDGNDKNDIEKYAEKTGVNDYCIFTGAIHDRELLRGYFSRADLFVFPSTYDTNGIVVREAAACGLGSILIKDSCAAEGITDGDTGLLVEENAESLGDMIISQCHNKDGLKRIGQNAMDKIYISWDDSVYNAYQRYGIVIDNYKRGVRADVAGNKDELFKFFSNLCSGMEKVQSTNQRVKGKFIDANMKVHDRIENIFDRYL